MDEEKNIEQKNIDNKVKEAINNELSAYMNPGNSESTQTNIQNNLSSEVTDSLKSLGLNKEKIAETPTPPKIRPSIVRTYKSDAEETIKSGHISSINMAIAESNRMLRKSQEQYVESDVKKIKINKTLIIMSMILVIGGTLAIGIPYIITKIKYDKKTIILKTDISKPIITADSQEKININSLNLNRVSTTLKERVEQSSTKLGEIKNIYLTEDENGKEVAISSTKFLSLIKAEIPPEISRTMTPQYMFGMHNFNGNQRFLILKTGSYDVTFSGMLSWETVLWRDFKEIFALNSGEPQNKIQNFGIEIKKFQDVTFNNKDCRVVKNTAGEIIFLYSIVDKNTVIITTNLNTLRELIGRINKATTVIQ